MPLFSRLIAVRPSNPRSMNADELAKLSADLGTESFGVDSPEAGIKQAFSEIEKYDALIVCGSLYLAGDVRGLLIEICGENTATE